MKNLVVLVVSAVTVLLGTMPLGAAAGSSPVREKPLKIQRVDTASFPRVKLDLGLTTVERAATFQIWENGRKVKQVKVDSKSYKEPISVTLLIDVSGSMKGRPLADAKAAAQLFVKRAQRADRISVVAFSTSVNRLVDFTDNVGRLTKAIDGLEARGETAVYDALRESLVAAEAHGSERQSVILLTDGADTASRDTAASVGQLASKLKIPVSAIALQSTDFNPGSIKNIAELSGGRLLTAPSSAALASLYDGLASELHNRYQLTYTSTAKKGDGTRTEVTAAVGGQTLRASTIVGAPRAEPVSRPSSRGARAAGRLGAPAAPWLAAVLGFIAVFLLTLALGNLILPSQNTLSEQLKYYDQLRRDNQSAKDKPVLGRAHQSLIEAMKRLSIKYDFAAYAQSKLEAAGLPVKPYEYMTMHVLGVIAVSAAAALFSGSTVTTLFLVGAGVIGPLVAVKLMILRRQAVFNGQLADTLDMLAASLRAGYGLQQAIVSAARETRDPMASELGRVSTQVQMGMPLEDALSKTAERVGSATFRWIVLAIAIHQETGGNLAEILDNLASSLRQRETMRRQIKALTAEGNLSAIILIALPFLEASILFWLNPSYMSLLVTTLPGFFMLMLALGLMGVGAIWLRNITQIDY